ncbi:methylglyoxal reductase (NADPH-dependent) gre2 [Physocladia obscura]|uniref:Methylglyoxal reductase (NADPH-dependent) gre2 n=1 Tax=Physocladia obscura TaxID=109957 RepID=A0AAD5SR40_9FUNG|nr:methylglyoxal reductase (NADPH-dependent) gre2 [Physocladia obscura]
MPTVLVTGISGFVGSHVTWKLLQSGFSVRGTVRSDAKAEQVRTALSGIVNTEKLSIIAVPDMSVDSAFDLAVEKIDFVVHTASPFFYSGVTNASADLVDPALNGVLSLLRSCAKSSVKRVVITSSIGALRCVTPTLPEGLSEVDWNLASINTFRELGPETPAPVAYHASKTLAEKAAWDFVQSTNPTFDLVVINPPIIFGPIIHPCASPSQLNTSVKMVADFYLHNTKEIDPLAAAGCIDVRDVARAHVLALTTPRASGQRILISSGPFTQEMLVKVLEKHFPGRPYPSGFTIAVPIPEVTTKAALILGITEYISLENMIVDTVWNLKNSFNI